MAQSPAPQTPARIWFRILAIALLITAALSPAARAGTGHFDPPDNPAITQWVDIDEFKVLSKLDDGLEDWAELMVVVDIDWGPNHQDDTHRSKYVFRWTGDTDGPFPVGIPLPPEGTATAHMECDPAAVPVVTVRVYEFDIEGYEAALATIVVTGGLGALGAIAGESVLAATGAALIGTGVGLLLDDFLASAGTEVTSSCYIHYTIQQALTNGTTACDPAFPGNEWRRGAYGTLNAAPVLAPDWGENAAKKSIERGMDDHHPVGKDPRAAQEMLRDHYWAMAYAQNLPPNIEGTSTIATAALEAAMKAGVAYAAAAARSEYYESVSLGISDSQAASVMAAADADSALGDYLAATDKYNQAVVRLLHINHPEYDVRLRSTVGQDVVAPTLSGLNVRSVSNATKSFFLYPSACNDLSGNSWAPRSSPTADSLDSYSIGTPPFDTYANDILGPLWQIAPGNALVTADPCHPEKNLSSNRMLFQGEPVTHLSLIASRSWIQTCIFAIPSGTAEVAASYNVNIPRARYAGVSHSVEYRVYLEGAWSRWLRPLDHAEYPLGIGGVNDNGDWSSRRASLYRAAGADSVQVRFSSDCDLPLTVGGETCSFVQQGLLIDDLRLEVTTGVPKPLIYVASEHLPQSTFLDGTMTGLNCSAPPCWPGPRGTDTATNPNAVIAGRAIDDNVNSPSGDFIRVFGASALGNGEGTGLNWRRGYEERTLYYTNADFNPAFDSPRMIYRLFDPATTSWSPWDSTELYPDDIIAAQTVTLLLNGSFRVDWPPQDKLDTNAALPGAFTVNGAGQYSALRYLPRGTRLQYYFKMVDVAGGTTYAFGSVGRALESVDLPALPGSSVRAPDIFEFAVLPGKYPPGPAGSLLAGRTDTPLLWLDLAYMNLSLGVDPITQALRGMGVRADRLRLQPGVGFGHSIGGHERAGQRVDHYSNHFPNMDDHAILDSLTTWYRLMVLTTEEQQYSVIEEQDAALLQAWAAAETGPDGGDRCMLGTGNDFFLTMTMQEPGIVGTSRSAFSSSVFGTASGGIGSWNGNFANPNPIIDDRFAAPASGPGLAAPGTFTYTLDGGCPRASRFDPLTADVAGATVATYPVFASTQQTASIAASTESDAAPDLDRTKALGYGFTIGQVRAVGSSPSLPNYVNSGVQSRMRILHKFLTGCRGARTTEPSVCWPCPTDPVMIGEWATQTGYQTGTYGPLYPIQAMGLATSVEEISLTPPAYSNTLAQNRPNPFNPLTRIPFSLERAGRVEMQVFDVSGRLVRTLVRSHLEAGPHEIVWDGTSDHGVRLASGVYFYRIQYPDGSKTSKSLVLLK